MGYLHKLGMAWGICLGLAALSWADPPAEVDYLVLKNGSVLTGRVVPDGSTYILRSLTSSGESRYAASMVSKLCHSATETYTQLKKSTVDGDASEHCRLARFCIENNLISQAKIEIDAALAADRRSTEAQALKRQLMQKLFKPSEKPAEVPALPGATVLPIAAASLDDWPVLQNAAYFHDYTTRIQPMLLAGCGTGACHGNAEGKRAFAIKRGIVGVPLSPLHSRSNLERTLALIDRENPETSELLKRAAQPHGNVKTWPVTIEQQQAWRQWALVIAGKTTEIAKTPSEKTAGKPTSQEFASGGTAPGNGATASSAPPSSSLPAIPGLSGGAIQQMGGVAPATPERHPPAPSTGSSLPTIPGVSGKAQGNPAPPAKLPSSEPPRAQVPPQESPQFMEYARRLGAPQSLPNSPTTMPERMRILNAGTYRIDTPPPPEFSEEVREMLRRQELAKKGDGNKDKESPSPAFLQSGTVVNGPR